MSKIERIKRAGFLVTTRMPVYRAIPIAKYRDYAAIHFMRHSCPDKIPIYLSRTNRLPDWRLSSLINAASILLAGGKVAEARRMAERASDINPGQAASLLVLSDIEEFSGNFSTAYQHAHDAWLLEPGNASAALRVVRLAYTAKSIEEADRLALVALSRFKRRTTLLWIACRYCYSETQWKSIREIWSKQSRKKEHVSKGARPLALGALHLGMYDIARDIYAEACTIELRGQGIGKPIKETRLAGKRGLSVLRDLREVLEAAKVPFFFAAGTALGIIRDGRPLDHDYDIDVGVFEEDWNQNQLASAFRKHPNFRVDPAKIDKPRLRLSHRGGAGVDIFQFYREGNNVFHDGKFVRWRNTAFQIEKRETDTGDVVYLPADSDRYLTENYGDWRTPDSHFDAFVDGPNAEVTCEEYLQVHRIRRAYKFIRGKNYQSAYNELSRIKLALEGSLPGRVLITEMQL